MTRGSSGLSGAPGSLPGLLHPLHLAGVLRPPMRLHSFQMVRCHLMPSPGLKGWRWYLTQDVQVCGFALLLREQPKCHAGQMDIFQTESAMLTEGAYRCQSPMPEAKLCDMAREGSELQHDQSHRSGWTCSQRTSICTVDAAFMEHLLHAQLQACSVR